MRETIPALKPSVVHLESNSDMSLPLCFVKEEPEEQAGGKDDKTEGGITVQKMIVPLQFCN